MHALACRATVSTKWTHEVPKASANIHLSAKGRVAKRKRREENGEPEFVSNLCDISGPLHGGCQVQCNHFYGTHSPHSLPRLATCPFYIQRSIIHCAAAPCNAATLATTCHCLLHNCRHLAGINYSLPRLTRCLIRKRM